MKIQLDQHGLCRVRRGEQPFLGEPPPEVGADADRDRRKRRPGGSGEEQGRQDCIPLDRGHQREQRRGEKQSTRDQNAPRPVSIDRASQEGRDEREADDIGRSGCAATRK